MEQRLVESDPLSRLGANQEEGEAAMTDPVVVALAHELSTLVQRCGHEFCDFEVVDDGGDEVVVQLLPVALAEDFLEIVRDTADHWAMPIAGWDEVIGTCKGFYGTWDITPGGVAGSMVLGDADQRPRFAIWVDVSLRRELIPSFVERVKQHNRTAQALQSDFGDSTEESETTPTPRGLTADLEQIEEPRGRRTFETSQPDPVGFAPLFNSDQIGAAAEFFRGIRWREMDATIREFEALLARLLQVSAEDARNWEATACRYEVEDEFDVDAEMMNRFTADEKASYLAQLVQIVVQRYGFVGQVEDASRALGELYELGIGTVVRGLNDISWGLC